MIDLLLHLVEAAGYTAIVAVPLGYGWWWV